MLVEFDVDETSAVSLADNASTRIQEAAGRDRDAGGILPSVIIIQLLVFLANGILIFREVWELIPDSFIGLFLAWVFGAVPLSLFKDPASSQDAFNKSVIP